MDLYQKHLLQKDIVEGFSSQSKEDIAGAMSDFDSYLNIVSSDE